MKVSYYDWIEQVEYIQKEKADSTKQLLIAASYTAWQQGAGNKKTFGEYLDGLGLSEKKPKLTKKQQRAIAIKSINTAKKILKMKAKRRVK